MCGHCDLGHLQRLAFKRRRWFGLGTLGSLATAVPLEPVSAELGSMRDVGCLDGRVTLDVPFYVSQ